ncbi:MAG: PAS domain S-box protein, partial [Paracoccus sp. (in: a-proteobacteria)]|nr:PAS domain S-box protein [Paracoccus sp. (in: a-proteobacteria)]
MKDIAARFYLAITALILVVAFVCSLVWRFHNDMSLQINDLSTSNSDSTQWFLAQSEVEFQSLRDTVIQMTLSGDVPPQDLRNRFDIFYARVTTLRAGKNFVEFAKLPEVTAALQSITTMLDQAVPVIDGSDATLRQAAPGLLVQLQTIAPDMRAISLEGVQYFSHRSDVRRTVVVKTLDDLFNIILLLFAVLAGALFVLFFMFRSVRMQNENITWARNRLHSLFETSIDAIIVADQNGFIQNYNASAERIYGYTMKEAIDADIRTIITPPDRMEAVNALLRQMRTGDRRIQLTNLGISQSTAKHKSGRIIPVEVSLSINQTNEGPLLVAFVRDVTRRVEAEAQLIEARDRAREGERAKARMIAVMNHEMRTPLNGILGTIDLMQITPLNADQNRFMGAMNQSAALLLQHVNDALDASRAYNDEIQLNLDAFDPASMIPDLLEGMRASAQKRGNRLTFECHGDDDRQLIGDVGKIRQVLVNLVGNAIKFTRDGEIVVQLDRIGWNGTME